MYNQVPTNAGRGQRSCGNAQSVIFDRMIEASRAFAGESSMSLFSVFVLGIISSLITPR
jgi:hypothetical protein